MQSNTKNNTTDQIDKVKKELKRYLRYWYLFVISIVVAFTLVKLKLRYTEKEFASVSKIKIKDKNKGLELPTAAFVFRRSNINLDNEIELIKSFDVLKKVVDRTDLTYRWFGQGTVLTTEIAPKNLPFKVTKRISNEELKDSNYKIQFTENSLNVLTDKDELLYEFTKFISNEKTHELPFDIQVKDLEKVDDYAGNIYILKIRTLSGTTGELKNALKVEVTGRSSDVLQLSWNSTNKERGKQVLSALHKVVIEDGKSKREAVLQTTIDFIEERFDSIQGELNQIEIGKEKFKVDNRFISPEADLQRGMTSAVQSEEQLFKVESQLNLLDFIKMQLEQETEELSLVPNSFNSEGIEVNSLITQYNDLIFQRNRLITSGGVNNPGVLRVNEELSELRINIVKSVDASIEQLKIFKQQLQTRDTSINAQFATLPEKERKYRDIERQQQIKETLYIFLMQKQEEARINKASIEPYIDVIEEPISYEIKASLNEGNYIFIALAAGLALPFGFLYLIFLLDTKLHGKEDVMAINPEIPIVGEIPEIRNAKENVFHNPNDRSVVAEAFRILSSNVDFLLPLNEEGKGQVIFCTSTIKGEGKTYVSMNLSLALSSINKKVLLIGADLRNPQIHSLIDEDKHKPGLSNYLHDLEFDWHDGLIKGFERHQNHDIMLSGSIPPNPAHLLTNGRFKKLIEEAREEYDYVVVDTAPTILVTDTMLISKLADATIYIARANFTDKSLLKFSKELFESGKLKNMAYVINSVGASRSYGYSYNYGYGYGYGSQA